MQRVVEVCPRSFVIDISVLCCTSENHPGSLDGVSKKIIFRSGGCHFKSTKKRSLRSSKTSLPQNKTRNPPKMGTIKKTNPIKYSNFRRRQKKSIVKGKESLVGGNGVKNDVRYNANIKCCLHTPQVTSTSKFYAFHLITIVPPFNPSCSIVLDPLLRTRVGKIVWRRNSRP